MMRKSRSAGCQPPTNAFSMNCWMKVMACSPLSWWWVGLRYSRILGAGLEGYMLGFGLRCAWHRIEVMGKTTGWERKISAGGGRAAVRPGVREQQCVIQNHTTGELTGRGIPRPPVCTKDTYLSLGNGMPP